MIERCFRFLIFEHTSKNPSKCSIPMPNGYHQWLRTEVLPLESVLRVWKGHSRSISGLILSLLGSLWPSWGSCGSPLGLSWCIFWARPGPGGDWIGFGGGQSSQVWDPVSKKRAFWHSSPDPADPPDPADQVSSATARDLPSTRAGGQDDVSSKQTPSNY